MKHICHWPNCPKVVPPSMWGCPKHWFTLPHNLRAAIWREYKPGQEIKKNPTNGYLVVADAVQQWIQGYEAKKEGK